jgi:hypothetical protein
MSTVLCPRIITSAASAPMTTAFLAAIRATGTSRNAAGFIVDAAGTARACFVNASGNWDLTATTSIGVPIDAVTFTALRGTWPSGVCLVNVALANGVGLGILVAAGPDDPPPPPPPSP